MPVAARGCLGFAGLVAGRGAGAGAPGWRTVLGAVGVALSAVGARLAIARERAPEHPRAAARGANADVAGLLLAFGVAAATCGRSAGAHGFFRVECRRSGRPRRPWRPFSCSFFAAWRATEAMPSSARRRRACAPRRSFVAVAFLAGSAACGVGVDRRGDTGCGAFRTHAGRARACQRLRGLHCASRGRVRVAPRRRAA